MKLKPKTLFYLGAAALFLAGALALFRSHGWLETLSPRPTAPDVSLRRLRREWASPLRRPRPSRAKPFDWGALLPMLLGVAGLVLVTAPMVMVLARAMPGVLNAPDAKELSDDLSSSTGAEG